MPRKPRLHYPGALYHVIARGNNQQAIFSDRENYVTFLRYLREIKAKKQFHIYAYCLMPNHFHFLIEVNNTHLSEIMQKLLMRYTIYHNRLHQKRGHLFQGRYKAFLCEKDSYLLELVRYIHLNFVRAKLAVTPGKWEWCGHHELGGHVEDALIEEDAVLKYFSGNKHVAKGEYRSFVRDGLNMGHRLDMYPEEKAPYLGDDKYIEEHVCRHEEVINMLTPGRKKKTVSLSQMLNDLSENKGIRPEVVQGGSRKAKDAGVRRDFIIMAYKEGHKAADIARFVGRNHSFVSRLINREFE